MNLVAVGEENGRNTVELEWVKVVEEMEGEVMVAAAME